MSLIGDLLAGPRGRDFLMEVALTSEGRVGPLEEAIWAMSRKVSRNEQKLGICREHTLEALARETAPLMEQVSLVEIMPTLLYDALEGPVFRATH